MVCQKYIDRSLRLGRCLWNLLYSVGPVKHMIYTVTSAMSLSLILVTSCSLFSNPTLRPWSFLALTFLNG